MLLATKSHTEGNRRSWTIDYSRWLDNTATITTVDVQSSSDTCTIDTTTDPPTILGSEVVFFLTGGALGETFTVTVMITDSFSNTRTDTIAFHVVSP